MNKEVRIEHMFIDTKCRLCRETLPVVSDRQPYCLRCQLAGKRAAPVERVT